MANNWQCYFKNITKQITVGDSLNLLCDGETQQEFKAPIKIEFLDKKHDYSLVVLETLKNEDYFLSLKVTSYRTGTFQQSFYITDGVNKLQIDNLSFEVHSVLTQKEIKPYGPYGPFKLQPHLLYVFTFSLSVLVVAFFSFLFTYRFFKRKKFIQSVFNRKSHSNPSKFFSVSLRKEQKDLIQSINHLERLFKTFLEDCLFIPALNQSHKQIIKNLKQYHPSIYKKEGSKVFQILNEFLEVKKGQIDRKSYFELKKFCQRLVFVIEEAGDIK